MSIGGSIPPCLVAITNFLICLVPSALLDFRLPSLGLPNSALRTTGFFLLDSDFLSVLCLLFLLFVFRKQVSQAGLLARFRRRKPSDRCACTKGVDIESNQPIRHHNSRIPQCYLWLSSLVVKLPGNKILVWYTSPENTISAVGLGRSNILCIVLIYLTVGDNLLKLTAGNFSKRSPVLLLLQDCIFVGTTAHQLMYRICYTLPR